MERWDQAFQPVEAPPGAEAFDWAPTQAEQEMLDRLGYEKSQFATNRWVHYDGASLRVKIERTTAREWKAGVLTPGKVIKMQDGPSFPSLLALLSWLEIEGARHG